MIRLNYRNVIEGFKLDIYKILGNIFLNFILYFIMGFLLKIKFVLIVVNKKF